MEPEGSLSHSQRPPPVLILSQINPVNVTVPLLGNPFSYYLPYTAKSSPSKSCILLSPYVLHAQPLTFFSISDYRYNICWEQIIALLCIWPSPLLCYVVALRSKYSPQHPILKHPQPQCERPSFPLIQNNRHNYNSVYFILYIFCIANWKAKDSTRNDSKRSLTSICSEFLPQWNFYFLGLFQNILNFHPFKEFVTYFCAVMFCWSRGINT